jgi:Arylsulfatase A and related enzymes
MIGKLISCSLLAVVVTVSHAADRPNILFCIADDAAFEHFSAYAQGNDWVSTPAFDRVARNGLLFTRAYTPNSKCAPSRANVLTGRNSWQLEEAGNHGGHFPAKFTTFMEALGRNGYFAGFTGKGWGPGNPGTMHGKPRELTGRDYSSLTAAAPTSKIAPTDYAANFAAFLKEKPAGQPFVFWYGCKEPHRDYEYGSGERVGKKSPGSIKRVPPYWPDTPEVRQDLLDYALEVEHYDRHLGRMLDELARVGELENTLIVVTSDNSMPFPRRKGTTYEPSLHMPLAIMWAAGIKEPGRTVTDCVSFIDFAPTFFDVAGVDPAEAGMQPMQGRSLRAIFRDEFRGAIEPGREYVLIGQERHDVGRPNDVGYPVRGILSDGFLYLHNFEPSRWPMCDPVTGYLNTDGGPTKTAILEQNRAGINHWIWELNFGRRPAEELYDLNRDPDCLQNLAADSAFSARRDRMREQLFAELRAQDDPRMAGEGEVFDRYPSASAGRDFYNRWMKGERVKAFWVQPTDFEAPDFDAERPLAPKAKQ